MRRPSAKGVPVTVRAKRGDVIVKWADGQLEMNAAESICMAHLLLKNGLIAITQEDDREAEAR